MTKRLVYGLALAPFVKKVTLVCEYKNLEYEGVPIIPPIQMSEYFLKISPLKKIPVLAEEDFSVADSSVIVAYLEKQYPEIPVYPHNSKQLAYALWIEEYADTILNEVCGHRIFVNQIVMPHILKKTSNHNCEESIGLLPPIFNYLEGLVGQSKTRMLVNDDLTIADISLAAQLICLEHCQIKIDEVCWPHLSSYFNRLLEEPVIHNAFQADCIYLEYLKGKP
ncbi:MAG: glutathione S-transferase family protein [Legionellaceae bacterium]|nr:glutathione S-transferase family protein [Legionellaceae bacterium]